MLLLSYLYKNINMPQLVPFYFMNQLTYGFLLIILLLILFSQLFLPMILRLYVSRYVSYTHMTLPTNRIV